MKYITWNLFRALLTIFALVLIVPAQTQVPNCTDLVNHVPRYPNGANVCVSRGAGITNTQWNAIVAGLENWNQTLVQQGHAVHFDYSHPNTCSSNTTMTLEVGSITNCVSGPNCVSQLTRTTNSAGSLTNATIRFDTSRVDENGTPALTTSEAFQKITQHEVGHSLGFGEGVVNTSQPNSNGQCAGGQISGSTVMNTMCRANDSGNNIPLTITPCDAERLNTSMTMNGAGPWPTPTPATCPQTCPDVNAFPPQVCVGGVDYCRYQGGCEDPWEPMGKCCCTSQTPIIIDVNGDGVHLTDAQNGVNGFDINGDGLPDPLSWTYEGDDDSWLVLDRNENERVDNGFELFGNVAPQSDPPAGTKRNGFRALAEYDKLEAGGNEDGIINYLDDIYQKLKLWRDINHNGVSEPNELRTLLSVGVVSISLDYRLSEKHDQNGNVFKYRAKITTTNKKASPWAWDVLLASPLLPPKQ